jgi:hypothetical protein
LTVDDHGKLGNSQMAEPRRVRIDFNRLRQLAHVGLQRAYIFMGFGLNAASNPGIIDFGLAETDHAQLVPPITDPSKLQEAKTAFGQWIVSCGVREAIETFAIFLDEVHRVCLFVAHHKGKLPDVDVKRIRRTFRRAGLPDKLKLLTDSFGVVAEWPDFVVSVHRARNCLVHRNGVVGEKDSEDGRPLDISWRAIEVFLDRPDGEVVVRMPIAEPVHVERGELIGVRWSTRAASFALGERVVLQPSQLAEICTYLYMETNFICNRAGEYLEQLGVRDGGTESA